MYVCMHACMSCWVPKPIPPSSRGQGGRALALAARAAEAAGFGAQPARSSGGAGEAPFKSLNRKASWVRSSGDFGNGKKLRV